MHELLSSKANSEGATTRRYLNPNLPKVSLVKPYVGNLVPDYLLIKQKSGRAVVILIFEGNNIGIGISRMSGVWKGCYIQQADGHKPEWKSEMAVTLREPCLSQPPRRISCDATKAAAPHRPHHQGYVAAKFLWLWPIPRESWSPDKLKEFLRPLKPSLLSPETRGSRPEPKSFSRLQTQKEVLWTFGCPRNVQEGRRSWDCSVLLFWEERHDLVQDSIRFSSPHSLLCGGPCQSLHHWRWSKDQEVATTRVFILRAHALASSRKKEANHEVAWQDQRWVISHPTLKKQGWLVATLLLQPICSSYAPAQSWPNKCKRQSWRLEWARSWTGTSQNSLHSH